MSWAFVFERDGENPCRWYVTETDRDRTIATVACEQNAMAEGQRLLARDRVYGGTHPDRVLVKRYDATSAGERASCNAPDLTGLQGWLS